MAYLSGRGFSYDVFISYAHIDDEGEGNEKWISKFCRKLQTTVEKLLGKPIDVWFDDNNLRGNHDYDAEIQEKINQSAVMVVCSSNAYNNSWYCEQEFKWFHLTASASKYGLKVKNIYRVSNVFLYDVPNARWAESISRSAGYHAFEKLTPTSIGSPLEVTGKEFNNLVQRVAEDIKEILLAIAASGNKKKIFFANVSKTLLDTRTRVISELVAGNEDIEVITNVPPPDDEQQHEQTVKQVLAEACLSVHLLNDLPGRDINGTETYLQKQADLAIATVATPQVFWISKNLQLSPDEVENNNHLKFLKRIDNGEYSKRSISYIKGVESDITREIQNKLKEVLSGSSTANPGVAANNQLAVLLETHQKDYSTTGPMVDILMNHKIIAEVNCESDQSNGLSRLEDKMSKVNSFLTIIGNAPQTSISRIDACIQLMLKYEMVAQAIYLAPNLSSRLSDEMQKKISIYKRFNFQILDDSRSSEFNPNTFKTFVQTIVGEKQLQ